MKRKETDNITGILIKRGRREKRSFPIMEKGYADCGEKGNKGYLAGTLYSGG